MWINENTKQVYKLHSEIRAGFPDVSLPQILNDDTILFLGLKPVIQTEKPAGYIVEESNPALVDNQWFQQWVVRTPTKEETLGKAIEVRAERDSKLLKTDWVIAKAYEQQSQVPSNYVVYRQALRDITNQTGFPWEITWPTL